MASYMLPYTVLSVSVFHWFDVTQKMHHIASIFDRKRNTIILVFMPEIIRDLKYPHHKVNTNRPVYSTMYILFILNN